MNESHAEEVLTRLLARKDGFGDTGVVVWRAARDKLGYLCGIDNGAMFEMRIARLRRIYEAFTPNDLLTRVSWLFEWGVLPEPHSITLDDKTRRLDAMRVAVVEEDPHAMEADDLMVQLIARLEEPDKLGRALSKCSAVASLQERLLQQTPDAWKPLIASFASGCFYTAKQDFAWLCALVLRWREENRSDDIVGTLHKIWAEPRVWDIVDELGESLRTLYWAGLKLSVSTKSISGSVPRHLLAAENFSTAFEMAAYRCEDLDTATLVEVLERFLPLTPTRQVEIRLMGLRKSSLSSIAATNRGSMTKPGDGSWPWNFGSSRSLSTATSDGRASYGRSSQSRLLFLWVVFRRSIMVTMSRAQPSMEPGRDSPLTRIASSMRGTIFRAQIRTTS